MQLEVLNRSWKLDREALVYAFLLLPFFDLDGLWALTGSGVRYGWGLISLAILCVKVIGYSRKIYLDYFNMFYLSYAFITLWSILVNGTLSFGAIYSFIIIWIVIQGIHYKKREVIAGIVYASVLIFFINIFSMFVFQEQIFITGDTTIVGRYSGIVGGRNSFALFFVLASNIVLYYYFKHKEKKVKYIGYTIWLIGCAQVFFAKSVYQSLVMRSTTGILIVTINIFLIVFRKRINIPKWVYLMAIIVINILLVGFNELILNTDVVTSILRLMGRGNDLSQRTYIWTAALTEIVESPEALLWGNGRGVLFDVPIRKDVYWYLETHNMFLQILYNSGILGFLSWCGCAFSAVWSRRNTDTMQILFIGFVCFLLGGLAESPIDKFLFWIMLGIMNEEKVEKEG